MRYLKLIISILIVLILIGCNTFHPRYSAGSIKYLSNLIDSIESIDKISLSDTSNWVNTKLETNDGIINTKLFYLEMNKRKYIISIIDLDSIIQYNYRVE